MTHPLDGARAKVHRANRHMKELETEIALSGYADSIGFAQEFHADANTIEVTLQGVPELPVEWALMAADCVQNLRSALNYLAWELSRWNLQRQGLSREPDRKTQFPINTAPRQFDAYRLPDVHPDHVAIIQSLQPNEAPFLSGQPEGALLYASVPTLAKQHVLGPIVELTNEDKHRVLPSLLTTSRRSEIGDYTFIDCVDASTETFIQLDIENGAKWAEFQVTVTGPEPKVEVGDKITPTVAFGGYMIEIIADVCGWVGRLLDDFAPVF